MNGNGTMDTPTLGTATNGTTDHRRLCIKTNNTITNDPCALCGSRCDPTGMDLFIEGTDALVCDFCGWEFEPQLMWLLRLADTAGAFTDPDNAIPPAEISTELNRRREARENTPEGCRERLEQAVHRRGMVLGHTDPVNEALALTVHQQGEDALAGDDFEKMRIALAALDQFEHRAQ